jgi:hypothetical protein
VRRGAADHRGSIQDIRYEAPETFEDTVALLAAGTDP